MEDRRKVKGHKKISSNPSAELRISHAGTSSERHRRIMHQQALPPVATTETWRDGQPESVQEFPSGTEENAVRV